ncbi:hypothetical protein BV25DRAFT_1823228 [Artomyces pyxidatus]|uniref:Uncharacterized protein n=1 Tax=Artomyces pyxidatus TaxID=48021 RepID=A0ACB8T761_9AGAM|nr:hypothetical protein BV25DRAFT_1823228 [Artomyces pyxidatus]
MHPSHILKLPIELICLSLSFLDMHDLITCGETCRFFHDLIADSPRLQYIIELGCHQMVPFSSPPGMSIAARRKLLAEREERWRSIHWKGTHPTRIPGAGSIYEFVGGVYGNGHGHGDDRRVSGSITFYQLPETGADYKDKANVPSWTLSGFDLNIIDFSIDPTQDLLVLVASAIPGSKCNYQVHLRTLSTNEPHPRAPSPVLDCRRYPGPETADMWTSFRIQILDKYLAVLIKDVFHTNAAFVAIWNWHAGADACCTMPLRMGIDDFCFLSPTEYMIVIPRGYLDVYAFKDPAKHKDDYPTLMRRFGLPRLRSGYYYWYISATANPIPQAQAPRPCPPFPASSPDWASSDPPTSSAPDAMPCTSFTPPPTPLPLPAFHARPDDGLIACSLGTLNPSTHAPVDCFVFFIRASSLLEVARSFPPEPELEARKVLQQTGHARRRSPFSLAFPFAGPASGMETLPSFQPLSTFASSASVSSSAMSASASAGASSSATAETDTPVTTSTGLDSVPNETSSSSVIQASIDHGSSTILETEQSEPLPMLDFPTISSTLPPANNIFSPSPTPSPPPSPARVATAPLTASTSYTPSSPSSSTVPHPATPSLATVPLPDLPPHPQPAMPHPTHAVTIPLQPFPAIAFPAPQPAFIHVGPSQPTSFIAWEDWGPPMTRWFGDMLSSDWQHAVHGFRTVERVAEGGAPAPPGGPAPDVGVRHRLRVRDYNPFAVKREKASNERLRAKGKGREVAADADRGGKEGNSEEPWEEDEEDAEKENVEARRRAESEARDVPETRQKRGPTVRLVTEPSTIEAGIAFAEDVVSYLPYREVVTEQAMEVSDVMLDDNRILCLKVRRNTLVIYQVLTVS